MGDIDFLSSGSKKEKTHPRSAAANRAAIEYTSGEKMDAPTPSPMRSQPHHTTVPKPPSEKRSFLLWRKKKHPATPAQPVRQPQPVVAQSASPIHTAPKHVKEEAETDLLHATIPSATLPPLPEPQPTLSHPLPPVQAVVQKRSPEKRQKKIRREKHQPQFDRIINFGVNLIPHDAHGLSSSNSEHSIHDFLYIAIVVIGLMLSTVAGLNMYEHRVLNNTVQIHEDIDHINKEIVALTPVANNARALHTQLEDLARVLNTHIYWTPFFSTVEGLTFPTIYYESLSGSATSGRFVFDVIAPDYEQLQAQVDLFRHSPMVEEVEVTSASDAGEATTSKKTDTTQETTADDEHNTQKNVRATMTVQFDPVVFQSTPTAYARE